MRTIEQVLEMVNVMHDLIRLRRMPEMAVSICKKFKKEYPAEYAIIAGSVKEEDRVDRMNSMKKMGFPDSMLLTPEEQEEIQELTEESIHLTDKEFSTRFITWFKEITRRKFMS